MKDKLKAFWAKIQPILSTIGTKIHADIADLWEKDKAFLVIFGVIILSVKFRQIMISLLVSGGKLLFAKSQQTSETLEKQEANYNSSADKLVEQAKETVQSDTSVGDDWYQGK